MSMLNAYMYCCIPLDAMATEGDVSGHGLEAHVPRHPLICAHTHVHIHMCVPTCADTCVCRHMCVMEVMMSCADVLPHVWWACGA